MKGTWPETHFPQSATRLWGSENTVENGQLVQQPQKEDVQERKPLEETVRGGQKWKSEIQVEEVKKRTEKHFSSACVKERSKWIKQKDQRAIN